MRGICLACVCLLSACAATDDIGVEELEVGTTNGSIAYGRMTPISNGTGFSVMEVEPDGSGLTRLPPGSEVPFEYDPAYSADGKHIAFASGSNADFSDHEIYRMNADGSCVRKLTDGELPSLRPDWSPDGTRIVFARACNIYTMNADGTDVTSILGGGVCDGQSDFDDPRWSPDGSKIMVSATSQIYAMNPDGTGLVRLTEETEGARSGDWSPDGTRIVFSSGGLHIMDLDSGEVTMLTARGGSASWSPNGVSIAFISDDSDPTDGRFHLYRIRADGTAARALVSDDAWLGSRIDWGRRFDGVWVAWTNAARVTQTCNSLTKRAAASNDWNAGAASVESLAGDGAVEFTTAETTTRKMAGLSNGDGGWTDVDIDFAIYLRDDGAVLISEGATLRKRVGSYAAGDVFRVQVKAGVVSYWQNGARLYRSLTTPTFPLLVDTSLRTPGATIQDVTLEAD